MKKKEFMKIDPIVPQIARYLLQHFYLQRKTSDSREYAEKFHEVYNNKTSLPIIFSTQLGYILGNKLYYAVKRNSFPLSKIRELFRDPFDEEAFDGISEFMFTSHY